MYPGIMTDRMIRSRCQMSVARAVFAIRTASSVVEHREPIYPPAYGMVSAEWLQSEAERLAAIFGGKKEDAYVVGKPACEITSPMIFPFEPQQVRQWERQGTDRELKLIQALGHVEAAKIIGGQIENMRIDPMLGLQIRERIISYGLSSMGYDVRLGKKFKIFTNALNATIDPLSMSEDNYVDYEGNVCVIPPNSYILGHTDEVLDLQPDELAVCLGKSTYARAGAIVNVTPIEPGFKGQVVIEISNATPNPLKVYAGQGIAQFLFFKAAQRCETSYADRDGGKGGKYQNQSGVKTAIV